jgi:hypothetical protein
MEDLGKSLSKLITILMIIAALILIFNRYDETNNQKKGTTTNMFSQIIFKGIPKLFKGVFNSGVKQEVKEGFQIIKTDIKEAKNNDYSDINTTKTELNKEVIEQTAKSDDALVSVETATEEELKEYNLFIKNN